MCLLKEQQNEIFLFEMLKDYTNSKWVKKIKAVKPFDTDTSF